MNRILVIGSGGSGKTHLSTRLVQKHDLPLYHLDEVFWGRNWTPVERSDYRAEVARMVAGAEWVIDGNYSSTFDLRVPRADTIVFLDRAPLLCLLRVVMRRIRYAGQTRPSVAPGNTETLTWTFVRYILMYRRTRRPKILKMLRAASHARTVILRSNAAIDRFVEDR